MAGGAVPSRGVMIAVTSGAGGSRWLGGERHGGGMALDAGQVGVLRVIEPNLPRAGRMVAYDNLDRGRLRLRQL